MPEYLPSSLVPGKSWSEEMDIVQLLDTADTDVTCPEGARIIEVSGATQEQLRIAQEPKEAPSQERLRATEGSSYEDTFL